MIEPEEGGTCPFTEGCPGTLGFEPVEECTCHIAPPCGNCVSNPLRCSVCRCADEDR